MDRSFRRGLQVAPHWVWRCEDPALPPSRRILSQEDPGKTRALQATPPGKADAAPLRKPRPRSAPPSNGLRGHPRWPRNVAPGEVQEARGWHAGEDGVPRQRPGPPRFPREDHCRIPGRVPRRGHQGDRRPPPHRAILRIMRQSPHAHGAYFFRREPRAFHRGRRRKPPKRPVRRNRGRGSSRSFNGCPSYPTGSCGSLRIPRVRVRSGFSACRVEGEPETCPPTR